MQSLHVWCLLDDGQIATPHRVGEDEHGRELWVIPSDAQLCDEGGRVIDYEVTDGSAGSITVRLSD